MRGSSSKLRLAPVCLLAVFLVSCATIGSDPNAPPRRYTQKIGFISGEPNQPLVPGREPQDFAPRPTRAGKPLVVLAISGGGSRSAFYAARVMEEMSRIYPDQSGESLLDSVRVISTVSAGSLAAAYYVAHFDERHTDPNFFQRFESAMAVNLQWQTYGNMMMFPPLALQLVGSSITRTDLLASQIGKLIAPRPLNFDDLKAKETRASDPAPVFVVNGTVYNSGQRLVMTNLPSQRFPSLIDNGGSHVALPEEDKLILNNLSQPLTFEDFGSDIGQYSVSHAVAASAAYPLILAPVRLRVYPSQIPQRSYWRTSAQLKESNSLYVADGGLYENQGIDALLSMVKSYGAAGREQPVMLVVIDASQRMETQQLPPNKVWGPFSVVSRMYDIGSMRPLAFYGAIAARFHDPKKLETVFIRMEGKDRQTEDTLKAIPTAFSLSSAHRKALDVAAGQNVAERTPDLVSAYRELSAGGGETKAHKSSKKKHP